MGELLQLFSKLESIEWFQPENSGATVWVNETSLQKAIQCRDSIYYSNQRAWSVGILPFTRCPHELVTDFYLPTAVRFPQ